MVSVCLYEGKQFLGQLKNQAEVTGQQEKSGGELGMLAPPGGGLPLFCGCGVHMF